MSRTRVSPFGQNAIKAYPMSVAASTDNVSVGGATNQAATVALSAQTTGATQQGSWVISEIVWSYSGAVTAGRLTVADSSGNLFDIDITAATNGSPGFGVVPFTPPLASQIQNSALTVTLGAAAGVTGKVNVEAYLEV